MNAGQATSVIRQLTRAAGPGPAATTPARALRLALTRAAERSSGLDLTVPSIASDLMQLDDVLSQTGPDLMLITLSRDGQARGFAALDLELRTALIEVQTMGRLGGRAAEPRPITATDAAMAQPLLTAFLMELANATVGTALDGWATGLEPDGRLQGARAAEQLLSEGEYRVVRLSVDLAGVERQGMIMLAIVTLAAPQTAAAADQPRFADALRANVMAAEAELNAVLHRLQLPLSQAEGLAIGQLLPLAGVTVSSVRLEAADGQMVGRARLGQTAGQRAVRIESALGLQLQEAGLPGTGLLAIAGQDMGPD
jgi:flagellar motor switch protein FliM